MKSILLNGVKQNNLKNIDVQIPIGSFTVICGPSGSGKSSLAFETLYAEGQRRYIDSLSNYAKQFLNKAPKPDIESIENIPPAIAIEQKNSVKNSRSTVGTTTEVIDYFRLLYEKVGRAYCQDHHIPLEKHNPTYASKKLVELFNGKRGYLLAPIFAENRRLTGKKLYDQLLKEGVLRVYVPKKVKEKKQEAPKKRTTSKVVKENKLSESQLPQFSQVDLGEVIALDKLPRKTAPKEDFFIVVDRLAVKEEDVARMADSITQAYQASINYGNNLQSGQAWFVTTDGEQIIFDEDNSCTVCNYKFPDISARLFSFNNPVGACPACNGFGNILQVDETKVVPNPTLSIAQGCIKPFAMPSGKSDKKELLAYCKKAKIDIHKPWEKLSAKHKKEIWDGNGDFYGVLGLFEYLEQKKYKMHVRVFLARHKSPFTCHVCKGQRLRPEASQVLVHGYSVTDFSLLTISKLQESFDALPFTKYEQEVASEIIRQIQSRLQYLSDVGVGYLSLNRETKTLSGGEYQRLNLANQLGMGLSQSLYVLDEPTVGLHPRDNDRLIHILKQLNELGNTLVVVEHDHDVIKNANNIIEIGPGSGHLGGQVIFSGSIADFYKSPDSITLPFLVPQKNWVPESLPRPINIDNYKYLLTLEGCKGHNLKNLTCHFPLNRMVTVTGVSGSGKSSLVSQTLYPALAKKINNEFKPGLEYSQIEGTEHIHSLLFIDQSPVGKTARSNCVTYLKVFDIIRSIFATLPESKAQGYTAGTFSLNVDGGRCPVCKGLGIEIIDMMFMDDIEIPCDACDGKKYREEILQIKYNKKNIADILKMTVKEAMDFFVSYPNIRRPLSVLKEVGLDYIQLGQGASTLSGGESQRLKLARELNLTHQKGTLFILDEPTTGLHFKEVKLLIGVLNKLIENGGSVILIEHNLEIIRNSDWVIDIGPEPGQKGGKIISQGTPADIIKSKKGHTSKYLKEYIESLTPASQFSHPVVKKKVKKKATSTKREKANPT